MKEKFFCSKSYLITYHRIVKNFFDGAKTIKPYRRAWVASVLSLHAQSASDATGYTQKRNLPVKNGKAKLKK